MPVDWVVKGVVFQALYSECPNQPVMVKPVLADAANGNVVKEINLCLCSYEGEVFVWRDHWVQALPPLTWVEVFSWGPSPVPKAVSGVLGIQAATGVPEPSSPGAVVLDRVTVGRGRAVPGVFASLRRQWRVYAVLD